MHHCLLTEFIWLCNLSIPCSNLCLFVCALTPGSVNPLYHSEEYNHESLSPRVTKYPRRETTHYSQLQRDTTQKSLYKQDGSNYSSTSTCEVTHILDLGNNCRQKWMFWKLNLLYKHRRCIIRVKRWYYPIWI